MAIFWFLIFIFICILFFGIFLCFASFAQVEMLYQRYFLRMNQSNTTHILALLLTLILALSCTHIVFTTLQLRRNFALVSAGGTSATIRLERLFLDGNVNGTGTGLGMGTAENTTHTTAPTLPQQMSQIANDNELRHVNVASYGESGRRQKRKHYRRQHKHRYKPHQHRARWVKCQVASGKWQMACGNWLTLAFLTANLGQAKPWELPVSALWATHYVYALRLHITYTYYAYAPLATCQTQSPTSCP